MLAVVFWRLRGGRFTASGEARRPLGPWPVDPAGVKSRADLIRAFEYLSLLRCGEPARTWHHRAIAACLGGTASDRRAAAAQLAELYEQARYAPAGGGEPDWTAARGPLTCPGGGRLMRTALLAALVLAAVRRAGRRSGRQPPPGGRDGGVPAGDRRRSV